VEEWLNELKYYSHPAIKVYLIGNKADLTEKREVSTEEGEALRNEYNLDGFYETSAKNGYNTNEIFREAARILYTEYKKIEANNFKCTESTGTTNSFKIRQRQSLENPEEENKIKSSDCKC
jgi:GTPase SAR1 family protein